MIMKGQLTNSESFWQINPVADRLGIIEIKNGWSLLT